MARFSLVRKGAIDLWKGFAADLRLTRLLETKAPESVEIKGISREKYNQRYEAYQQELREFRWGAREQIDRKKIEAERPKTADNTTDVSQRGMSENEKNSESVKLKAERRQKEMERKKLAVFSPSSSSYYLQTVIVFAARAKGRVF